MVIGIFGENCSGKSTLADILAAKLGAEVVSGKDYLRMARSPSEAERLFRERLRKAAGGENEERIVYVFVEREHLALLPEGATRIYVRCDLDVIKARFTLRMHGHLPQPVATMLEKKHGSWEDVRSDYVFDGATGDAAAFAEAFVPKA